MPLVLAIEPDRRQAAQLTNIVRQRVGADLVLADTTESALESIGNRVPDLVLVPALLSPQDDAALATALRVIATAAHVQMLTIPVLAAPRPARPARRGMLSSLLGEKADAAPDGCEPAVFAEQIAEYLARGAEERAVAEREAAIARADAAVADGDARAVAAPAADVVSAEIVREFEEPEAPAERLVDESTPPTAPSILIIHEEARPTTGGPSIVDAGAPRIQQFVISDGAEGAGVADAGHQAYRVQHVDAVRADAFEPLAEVVDQAPVVLAAAPSHVDAQPVVDAPLLRDESSFLDSASSVDALPPVDPWTPPNVPAPVDAAPPLDVPLSADASLPADPLEDDEVPDFDPIVRRFEAEIAALTVPGVASAPIDIGPSFDSAPAESTLDSEEVSAFEREIAALSPASMPLIEEVTPASWGLDPDEPAEDSLEDADADEDDIDLTAAIDDDLSLDASIARTAFAQAVAEFSEAVEALEPDGGDDGWAPAAREPVEPIALTAWRSWPDIEGTTAVREADPVELGGEKLEDAGRTAGTALPAHSDGVDAPSAAAASVAAADAVAADAWHAGTSSVAPGSAAPQDEEPNRSERAEHPEWVELIDSLRRDIQRLRTERLKTTPVAPAPAPAQAAAVPAAESKTKRNPNKSKPLQDEWGLFDPEQCGFAALLDKLDEITETTDDPPARRFA
jgi:hypothetical protein